MQEQPHFLATYLNDSQKDFETENAERLMPASVCKREIWSALVQPTLPLLQDEPTVKVFNEMNFEYGTLEITSLTKGLVNSTGS